MSYTGKLNIPFQNGYPCNVYSDNLNESGIVPPPPIPNFRDIDNGDIRSTSTGDLRIVSP